MINKIPKTVMGKWQRYTKLEKWFIVYCLLLILIVLLTPIWQRKDIESWDLLNNIGIFEHYRLNEYILTTWIILILTLLFLLFWNISFRFKKAIHNLIWFKDNDALLNFIFLWIISVVYLGIFDTTRLLSQESSDSVTIYEYAPYIWLYLIIWLIWNLFLALNLSKNKKKSQMINIVQHKSQAEEINQKKEIKWLFE